MTGTTASPRRQAGAALLLVVLALVAVASVVLIGRIDASALQRQREAHDRRVLQEAKDAVIGWALRYYEENPDRFGFLPCPDRLPPASLSPPSPPVGTSEGTNCGLKNANVIGHFPWRTLGTGPLKDSDGACLWYAVSGTHKVNANLTDFLNDDTPGAFEVSTLRVDAVSGAETYDLLAGAIPDERAVAVIIAPGGPLAGQSRTTTVPPAPYPPHPCPDDYDPAAYVEGRDPAGPLVFNNHVDSFNTFVIENLLSRPAHASIENAPQQALANAFNDRLAVITQRELWDAIRRHNDNGAGNLRRRMEDLTRDLALCVQEYGLGDPTGQSHVPWAAALDLLGGDYAVDAYYIDQPDAAAHEEGGRLPDSLPSSNAVLGYGTRTLVTDCSLFPPGSVNLTLWQQWKDHFFLSIGDAHEPDEHDSCSHAGCVTVTNASGTDDHFAVVIYAGRRTAGQSRVGYEYGSDTPTRQLASNYLEDGNDAQLQSADGDESYVTTGGGNDFFYCIRDAGSLQLEACQ